ncbi:replication initiation protein [Chondrinema litorale]|uniref:replication initiation protein n=1 Tax=Chondrinema litorale TaxID=2994555 RepID=UPI00254295EE|nr:replication initiation protein [Chondrinema litorale]UZS00123.1 replication initiation protein [Chondrinema litorale]
MSIKKNSLIVKSNDLINSRYSLSVSEMRLILLMVSQVSKDDEDFKTYRVQIKDFIESTGKKKNSQNLYSRAKEYSKQLMKRVLEIPQENGTHLQVTFLSSALYYPGQGYVDLRFDPSLKPYLLQLKSRFTSYDIRNVLSLRSFHSIRIYELLKQYEKIGNRTFKVDELKEILNIADNYSNYNLFKRRVIEQAQKELTKNCDITFQFEEIKLGRKVVEVKFTIIQQRTNLNEIIPILSPTQSTQDPDLIKEELMQMGISGEDAKLIVDQQKKDPVYLRELIQETQRKFEAGKVKNTGAYLAKLISTEAQVNSKYQKQAVETQKKKEVEQSTKRNNKSNDKKLIKALKEEYEEYIHFQEEKAIKSANNTQIEAFEKQVKSNIGMSRILIKKGKLDKEHDLYKVFFGGFLLPRDENDFEKWVLNNKGFQIKKDLNSDEDYVILAKQKSIF